MKPRIPPQKVHAVGEPVGIVISRGRDVEPPPVFSAYMYAPAPDSEAIVDRALATL